MGCGCGKRFTNPSGSGVSQRVTSIENPIARQGGSAPQANVVRSAPVPQGLRSNRSSIQRGRV